MTPPPDVANQKQKLTKNDVQMNLRNSIVCSLLAAAATVGAQNNMVLNTKKTGAAIQPTMYGLFFEDINYAADGGLYAEMVKNRSFEFPQSLMGWEAFGGVEVRTDEAPFERNPHYVRLTDPGHAHKRTGLQNEGFFGMSVVQGKTYDFSVWARAVAADSKIRVEIVDPASGGESQVLASQDITVSGTWTRHEAQLSPRRTCTRAKLRIFLASSQAVDLEHVSLFPADTWKGRKGGLRADLVQALADIKPGVFRFPGGCIVEGTDLESRYDWKKSVGPVENRPLNENRWHYTFPHRFYPDYYQSYGLGFYEFFLLSEEIGAEPLPVLSCGLACQFQNKDPKAHVPVDQLQPYIQDALDLIEFANGSEQTEWGRLRAEMGHPAPFGLKLIGIGNEQWGSEYPERLEPFVKAIRAKYPDIKIVGTSGPDSEGKQFDYLWPEMRRLKADLVDEHFYRPEAWFLAQGARYDAYDRKGPKVFAGEYACHGKGKKWNHFHASLLEAAFMTGLERNADVVHMATYAPLFAHVDGWQWRPDMIWYDNTRSVRTASYYVQQLYAHNKGTNVAQLTMNGKAVCGADGQNGLFASAVWDADSRAYIVKIANTSDTPQPVSVSLQGRKLTFGKVTRTTLHSDNPDLDNTLDAPFVVVPVTTDVEMTGSTLTDTIGAQTFALYRISL